MKRIIRICVLSLAIALLTNCEAPDQELFSVVPYDVQANSTDPLLTRIAQAQAYIPLIGTWGGHNSLWSLHEISSDEMVIAQKGADWEDGGQWIRVHRQRYLPTEESINNGWGYCYSSIATLNNLLRSFGTNEPLRAELETVRALVYLWLIDAYGNVPIITETTTDTTPPTATRAEVFDFIETSILDNIDLLTDSRDASKVNKWVAFSILAKLYLNAEVYTGTAKWNDAARVADSVILSGKFSLEPKESYFRSFATNNIGASENIFVINYDAVTGRGFNLPQMTLHYSSQETFNLQQQPWNGYASLEEFYNLFDEDDVRRDGFLVGPQFSSTGQRLTDISAESTDPDGPDLTFTPEINELAPNSLRQAGARVGKFEFALGSGPDLSNDFPIFRYSDIILVRAEALWRQNSSSTEALSLVNQIRSRAGINNLMTLTSTDLLAERGREMFAEGHRRSDLIRFGRFNDAWWEKDPTAPFVNLFPIPQPQIQTNGDLIQNPGYGGGG